MYVHAYIRLVTVLRSSFLLLSCDTAAVHRLLECFSIVAVYRDSAHRGAISTYTVLLGIHFSPHLCVLYLPHNIAV